MDLRRSLALALALGLSAALACSSTASVSEVGLDLPSDEAAPPADADAGPLAIRGAWIIGHGRSDILIEAGVITAIDPALPVHADEVTVAAAGLWVAPAAIDSHVHLDYVRAPHEMAAGGVAAAVDLGAPERLFDERARAEFAPLTLLAAGPILAAPGGYPTQSWGRDGFGRECEDLAAALAAVDELADRGAALIKVALAEGPRLDDATLAALIDRAHARGLRVAAHALGDADARLAGELGVDVLAHTPLEPLTAPTLALWSGRAVISTLDAFGAGEAAVANLRALRDAGATILYGTDFGNSQAAGIDPRELSALTRAGLDGAAILAAMGPAPAEFWGLAGHGRLEVGAPASLLLLRADPQEDPQALAWPRAVLIAGRPLADEGPLAAAGIAVEEP